MIPRRIVQTHRDPAINSASRQTWREHHPGFEYLFFDDEDCSRFMRDTFPSLWDTYCKLPLPVQKADMFRYAAIYHFGGIYADVDTVCLLPMTSYIDFTSPRLVAGIEMSPESWHRDAESYMQNYCMPIQLLQWVFASPPRHHGLKQILQRIALSVASVGPECLQTWSKKTRFTLELTGPMLFTQVLLGRLTTQQPDVQILPRYVWGALPREFKGTQVRPKMAVAHLFQGSWKPEWQEARRKSSLGPE